MSHYFKLTSTDCLVDDNYNYSYSTFSPPQGDGPGVHAYPIFPAQHDKECLSKHLVNKIMPIKNIVEPFIFIFLHNIKRSLHLTNVSFLQGFPALEDQEERIRRRHQ